MFEKWIVIFVPLFGGICVVFWLANQPKGLIGESGILLATLGVVVVLAVVSAGLRHETIGGDDAE